MPTQTLMSRRDKTKFAPVHVTVGQRGSKRPNASPARGAFGDKHTSSAVLAQVEERLLAAAVAHHPNSDTALEALLDDLDLMERSRSSTPRSLPAGEPSLNLRMEDLLLEAIVRTHPNRDAALDRLLSDACGDAALDCCHDETAERVQFDAAIDNDFDGMA